jgi:hypothetical protein
MPRKPPNDAKILGWFIWNRPKKPGKPPRGRQARFEWHPKQPPTTPAKPDDHDRSSGS